MTKDKIKRTEFNERNFGGGCSNIADGRLRLLHKYGTNNIKKSFFECYCKIGRYITGCEKYDNIVNIIWNRGITTICFK